MREFSACRAPEKTYPAHVSGLKGKVYMDPYCTASRDLTGDDWSGPEGKFWVKRQWWRP